MRLLGHRTAGRSRPSDRIDSADVHRSQLRDDAEGKVTAAAVLNEHPVERLGIDGEVRAARNEAYGFAPEVEHVGYARHRDVAFMIGHVDPELPFTTAFLLFFYKMQVNPYTQLIFKK